MANRVATSGDLPSYPQCIPPMQVGDVIIDSATTDYGDGHPRVLFTNVGATFPTARLGATIWLDGSLIPTPCLVGFHNNGEENEWPITDEDNYATVKPITGTQVRVVRTANSSASHRYLMQGLKYWILDGESDAYPGMRDGIHSGLRGTFGLWACEDASDLGLPVILSGGHGFSLSTYDGGHLIIRGVHAEHGFSSLRNNGGQYTWTTRLTIERCLLNDGESGEGFYLGRTGTPPIPKYSKLEIRDCLVVRRAAEALQLQHLIDSMGTAAVVRNLVMWQCDMDWLSAFQGGQDTGIQWDCNQGNNQIKDSIIGQAASVGYNKFTSGNAGEGGLPLPIPGGPPAVIQNCLFYDCRGILTFSQNSTIFGVRWLARDIFALDFNDTYYYNGLNTLADYYIGQNGTTDKHQFIGLYTDGFKPRMFEDRDDGDYETADLIEVSLPAPVFEATGVHERPSYWMNWKPTYGSYHDIANGTPVLYMEDWVVCNVENGVEYAFYKCLNTHTSAGIRPRLDPTNWVKLTWDTAWVRSDQPGWNSLSDQSLYPPFDFRLVSNNHWNKRRMGALDNKPNTDWSYYQWYRSNSPSGSSPKRIPNGNSLNYTPQECDRGKYISLAITPRDNAGNVGETTFSPWRLVS